MTSWRIRREIFFSFLLAATILNVAQADAQQPTTKSEESPTPAVSSVESGDKIRVACVGASITAGFGTEDHAKQAYPAQMQSLLGDQYDVRNFGASGCTMLKKGDRPYWDTKAYKQALDFKPNIVVIDLGGNDSKAQNWKHKDDFAADSKAMVESFQSLATKPRVLICLPMPSFKPPSDGINDEIIKQQSPMLRDVAADTHAQLVDLYVAFQNKKAWFKDGVHPNVEGAALMAQLVSGAITTSPYVPFEGEKTKWHDGFDRYDFMMDDDTFELKPFTAKEGDYGDKSFDKGHRRCIVVVPKEPRQDILGRGKLAIGIINRKQKSSC